MVKFSLPKEKTFSGPALIWKRILAFFIDMLLINLVVLFPFQSMLSELLPKELSFSQTFALLSSDSNFLSNLSVISIAMAILVMLYFIILEYKMGQSIGKYLLKIYVTSDKKELKLWQAVTRSLFFVPVFPLVFLIIIDPLFMVFNKSNQRLTEILSKTKVMQTFEF